MAQKRGGLAVHWQAEAPPPPPQDLDAGLCKNARVQVVGLQDRPELNGASGVVLDFDAAMQRWRVRLDTGSRKMFKLGNLRCLDDDFDEKSDDCIDDQDAVPDAPEQPQASPAHPLPAQASPKFARSTQPRQVSPAQASWKPQRKVAPPPDSLPQELLQELLDPAPPERAPEEEEEEEERAPEEAILPPRPSFPPKAALAQKPMALPRQPLPTVQEVDADVGPELHRATLQQRVEELELQAAETARRVELILEGMGDHQAVLDALSEDKPDPQSSGRLAVIEEELKVRGSDLEDLRKQSDGVLRQSRAHAAASASRLASIEAQVQELRQPGGSMPRGGVADIDQAMLAQINVQDTSAVDSLRSQMDALQECLGDAGVLSSMAISARMQQHQFKSLLRSTGWTPSVSVADLTADETVMAQIAAAVGPAALCSLRLALGSRGCSLAALKVQAQGALQHACQIVVRSEHRSEQPPPGAIQTLRQSIELAEDAGVDAMSVRAAKATLKRISALSALSKCTTKDELAAAMQLVETARIDPGEIEHIVAAAKLRVEEVERTASVQRKLRIAMAWTSKKNLDPLRRAITDAEEANIDSEELEKAKATLRDLLNSASAASERPQKAAAPAPASTPVVLPLLDFLQAAKPGWSHKDSESALTKLAVIGVYSTEALGALLSTEMGRDQALNDQLRAAGQKVFNEDTVRALRQAYIRHASAA